LEVLIALVAVLVTGLALLATVLWRWFAFYDGVHKDRTAAIAENVNSVKAEVSGVKTEVAAMARDVAFLAGRQAERDQA